MCCAELHSFGILNPQPMQRTLIWVVERMSVWSYVVSSGLHVSYCSLRCLQHDISKICKRQQEESLPWQRPPYPCQFSGQAEWLPAAWTAFLWELCGDHEAQLEAQTPVQDKRLTILNAGYCNNLNYASICNPSV